MAKYRVWNKHPDGMTHKERFRDQQLEIAAGDFILMDYEDAVQFKGQYFPMKMNAMNQQMPETYKCIMIEPDDAVAVKPEFTPDPFICHYDGKKFDSATALAVYVKENYSDQLVVDEAAEREAEQDKKRSKKEAKV